uniref:Pro-apoptotic serine protease nma111 n=1 Tax=Panagrellus redivivus TaxID=6233 RepID=A0A7E4VCJ9_PANRE
MSRKRTYYDAHDYGASGEPRPPGFEDSSHGRPHDYPDNPPAAPSQSQADRGWDAYESYGDRYDHNNGHQFHGNADQRYPNNGGRPFPPPGDYPRDMGYQWYGYQPRFDAPGGPPGKYQPNSFNYLQYPPPGLPGGRGRGAKRLNRPSQNERKGIYAPRGNAVQPPTPTTPKLPISSVLSMPSSSSPGSKLATVSAVANAMLGQTNKKQQQAVGARSNGSLKVGADGKSVVVQKPANTNEAEREKSLTQKMYADGKPPCEVLYPGNRLPTGKFIHRRPANNGSSSSDNEDEAEKSEVPPPSRPVVVNHPIMKPLPPLRSNAHVAVPFVTMTTSSKSSAPSSSSRPFFSPPVASLSPVEPQLRVKSEPPDYASAEPTTEQLMALFEQNQDKFINEDVTPPPIEPAPSVSPAKHREGSSPVASPPTGESMDAVPDYVATQASSSRFKAEQSSPIRENNNRYESHRSLYQPYEDPPSTEATMLNALENELMLAQQDVLAKQAVVRDLLTQQMHAQTDLEVSLQRLNNLSKTVFDLKRQS